MAKKLGEFGLVVLIMNVISFGILLISIFIKNIVDKNALFSNDSNIKFPIFLYCVTLIFMLIISKFEEKIVSKNKKKNTFLYFLILLGVSYLSQTFGSFGKILIPFNIVLLIFSISLTIVIIRMKWVQKTGINNKEI